MENSSDNVENNVSPKSNRNVKNIKKNSKKAKKNVKKNVSKIKKSVQKNKINKKTKRDSSDSEDVEDMVFISDTSDEDYVPEEDLESDDSEIMNGENYQKFLYSLFPSRYLKNKIEQNEKQEVFNELKQNAIKSKKKHKSGKRKNKKKSVKKHYEERKSNSDEDNEVEDSSEENENVSLDIKEKSNRKNTKIKKGQKNKAVVSSEEEYEREYDLDFEDDELSDEDVADFKNNGKAFSIIYSFADMYNSGSNYEDNVSECSTDNDNEDSDVDSDIYHKDIDDATEEDWEKVLIKEEKNIKKKEKERKEMLKTLKAGDRVKVKYNSWNKKYKGTIKKIKGTRQNKKLYTIELDNKRYKLLKNVSDSCIMDKVINEEKENKKQHIDLKKLMLLKKTDEEKYNEKIKEYEAIFEEEAKKEQEKKERKIKNINLQRLKKLLNKKNNTSHFTYFKKMKINEQRNILKNLVEINKISIVDKPYKIQLLESNIDPEIKSLAMKKINTMEMMDPCSGDYYKNKLWVDTFMNIPFGKYSNLTVNLKDNGIQDCRDFMNNAKTTLDECVYGLNDAKMQIMQMIGSWISNPQAAGTAIAIHGPMGTGKTTLVKDGISKILNRPFAFIPLGGATDSSYLEGHSYTYEGSMWGKIVDVLIRSKSMNPIFYFDELDKVSNTPKGEEIIGILTHLTDLTQNTQFHDKYFSNLDFDLSKAIFIFSYNHEEKVNPILKDRMYRIETAGYEKKDKRVIAKKYLIPKIAANINFNDGDVIINDEIIDYIVEKYTMGEKGVRNLKRCLEIIFSKLNLFRLLDKETTLFNKEEMMDVSFPLEITETIIKKLIKEKDKKTIPFGMYI